MIFKETARKKELDLTGCLKHDQLSGLESHGTASFRLGHISGGVDHIVDRFEQLIQAKRLVKNRVG